MYRLTRASSTLIAAGVAGLLIWLATTINDHTTGGYWAAAGLLAGAGLVMALFQLLGGWTKWGVPRFSMTVLLAAFIPVLIAAGWIIVAHQPHGNWARHHALSWSSGIHIRGLVDDLTSYVSVLAFGIGLVFGYSFDTTGPRQRTAAVDQGQDIVTPADLPASDEPVTSRREPIASEGEAAGEDAPADEVAPNKTTDSN